MKFDENNLSSASSPYLLQHKNQPIWWQEWKREVLDYSQNTNKPIFVSVGYSTCHWCHVMAREAFSNPEVAELINQNFVAIKVDREQRPDIDHYLMKFLIETTGRGGWPLNVFLTPDLKPIYALSYCPVQPKFGMPGFSEIIRKVVEFFNNHRNQISDFKMRKLHHQEINFNDQSFFEQLTDQFYNYFDPNQGGFGKGHKFPPHSTLLFLLYYSELTSDKKADEIIVKTLDAIIYRGLHDHLQGGFFRYCTDPQWTIPHFEKMLYDQAMLLWVNSLAYIKYKNPQYLEAAVKIVECLDQSFKKDDFYISALDADTDHQEGLTYLWSYDELKSNLSAQEFESLKKCYYITEQGNYEGKNHLVKKSDKGLAEIEQKLLEIRQKKPQPAKDEKILIHWNCLCAIGLIFLYRATNNIKYLINADNLYNALLHNFYKNNKLAHSLFEKKLQKQEFLEDYASLLLLSTFLYEDSGKYLEDIEKLKKQTEKFKFPDGWLLSINDDFKLIPADNFDHPIPSPISLLNLALLRLKILTGKDFNPENFKNFYENDFYNIGSLVSSGFFHLIETPEKIPWIEIPINTIQIKGDKLKDCYKGRCINLDCIEDIYKIYINDT